MFTFTGRISAKRKAPDAVVFHEGIASAISEEKNTADGRLTAGRKLTARVNMAHQKCAFGHEWSFAIPSDDNFDPKLLAERKYQFRTPPPFFPFPVLTKKVH